jgi:isopenicillin-N N-acyltransferase-like protein
MEGFPQFISEPAVPATRGRSFGAAWRTEIESTLRRYRTLFAAAGVTGEQLREWGSRALDQLAEWSPPLADEVAGIAAGAGLDVWQVAALNARTEVLAAARARAATECSTAVVIPPEGGPPRTIQTWDWNDTLADAPMTWMYQPRPERPEHVVRAFTEFGVLGKIGVNSAGVGVHFNILRHAADHDRIGVPVHAVARRILDEAFDVDQALEIASSATVSASTVVTVVAFDGERARVAGLELCPTGVGVVPADDAGVYVHTNHFLDPAFSDGERLGPERPNTYHRLQLLQDRADRLGSPDLMERARAMLGHSAEGLAPVCSHVDAGEPLPTRSVTLATVSLDLAEHRLTLHRGGPCQVTAGTWQQI